ncbi:hypothetical protein, partial [Streptomyces sp. NPDC051098]|uniref:hypothetical protein n=2 Tax=unclassified Streptomyces TaxID=2593676 RepID=UPI003418B288
FSRNGRFLCTHPLGLSSGRFPSVLRFQPYQILFPFRFRWSLNPMADWSGLSPFGCTDFIRSISAELISLSDPDRESIGSAEI